MKKLFLGSLVVMFMFAMTLSVAFAHTVNTPTGGPVTHDINLSLQVNAGIALTCYDTASASTTDHDITMSAITQDGQSSLAGNANKATCNVRTNNGNGYSLAISSVGNMTNASSDTIVPIAAGPAAWSVTAANSGWGYIPGTATDYTGPTWSGASGQIATASTETGAGGTDHTTTFGAEVGTSKIQPTGTYTETVTFTATTLP